MLKIKKVSKWIMCKRCTLTRGKNIFNYMLKLPFHVLFQWPRVWHHERIELHVTFVINLQNLWITCAISFTHRVPTLKQCTIYFLLLRKATILCSRIKDLRWLTTTKWKVETMKKNVKMLSDAMSTNLK